MTLGELFDTEAVIMTHLRKLGFLTLVLLTLFSFWPGLGQPVFGQASAPYTLTVNISPADSGAVSITPNQSSYTAGAQVTLRASPTVGYSFGHWDLYQGSVASHPTTNPLTVAMNADTTAIAHFTQLPTLTVSISPADSGAVSINRNRSFYELGTPVTLTASPTVGYSFDHWDLYQGSVASHPTTNPLTVAMNADTTAIAHFTDTYIITATAGAGGAIMPSGAVTVNHGANQTFTITPDSGYRVSDVGVDSVSKGSLTTYTFTNITANHTIAASFAITLPPVTPTPTPPPQIPTLSEWGIAIASVVFAAGVFAMVMRRRSKGVM